MVVLTHHCVVVLFVCMFVVCVTSYGGPGSRNNENSEMSMSDISEKLEILANEVKLLKDVEATPPFSTFETPVIPIEASRTVTSAGVVYSVFFEYDVINDVNVTADWLVFHGDDGFSREIPESNPRVTSFLTRDSDEGNHVLLRLYVGAVLGWEILLGNTKQGNSTAIITIPKIELQPRSDLVYEPGQNVTFKIRTPIDDTGVSLYRGGPPRSKKRRTTRDLKMTSLDMDSKKLSHVDSHSMEYGDYYTVVDRKEYLDFLEETIQMNTAKHHISGYIYGTSEIANVGDLVWAVGVGQRLILRPSGQPGPFPEDFMTFTLHGTHREMYVDKAGNDVQLCSNDHQKCSVTCNAYGSNIDAVQLRRMLPTGPSPQYVTSSGHGSSCGFGGFESAASFCKSVRHEISVSYVAPSDEMFTCTARDTKGKTLEKNIRLHVYRGVVVQEEETGLSRDDQNVTVTCAAVGDPRPELTFAATYDWGVEEVSLPDVTSSEGSKVTGVKTFPAENEDGELWSVSCVMKQTLDVELEDAVGDFFKTERHFYRLRSFD